MGGEKERFRQEFKRRIYRFVKEVMAMIGSLPRTMVSLSLGEQLLRSASGILANYIEGKSASSRKEFIHYLEIALRSGNESKVWLKLLADSKKKNR